MNRRRFVGGSIIESFFWNSLDGPLVCLEYRRDHFPIPFSSGSGNYTRPISRPIVFVDGLEP
jgi:hypothetical protein